MSQNSGSPLEIFTKLVRREPMQSLVCITMTADFMPRPGDLLGYMRKLLGHPSQNEKCSANRIFLEHVQNPGHVALYTALIRIPLGEVDPRSECLYVKIIFDVNAQHIVHISTIPG